MSPRGKGAGDALARPAMPSATTAHARPGPTPTRRMTIDLPVDDHLELRRWATEAGVPASLLVLALLKLGQSPGQSPAVRARAQALAVSMAAERADKRSVGQ